MKHTCGFAGLAGIILLAGAATAQPSLSSRYNFVKIEVPGALFSYPLGINDRRQMVGVSVDTMGVEHGFLFDSGKFTIIDYPGAPLVPGGGSATGGINNRGDIVGVYNDKDGFQHGFLRARPAWCDHDDDNSCKPVFTSIDDPAAAQTKGIPFELGPGLGTASLGINDFGVISGMYATHGLFSDGFVLRRGEFDSVDHPGASHSPGLGTKLFGIGDSGAIAGDYITQDNAMAPPISHGFLLEGGRYTPIEVPGSPKGGFGTQVNGVNAFRIAVGLFSSPVGQPHGLVWISGNYFTLDHPDVPFTELHSINNRGDITGAYIVDPVTQFLHGFVAYPKDR